MATANTKQEIRGLALPALRRAGGYFASKNKYDTAWGDVLRAIFTPVGSVPAKRDYGSALHRLMFEPDLLNRQQLVTYVITQAVKKWCPHVTLRDIALGASADGKTFGLRVKFSLTDELASVQERMVDIPFSAVRVLSPASGS